MTRKDSYKLPGRLIGDWIISPLEPVFDMVYSILFNYSEKGAS